VLSDELRAVRARHPRAPPEAFVFATRGGGRQDARNFRARVLLPAIERANLILAERDRPLRPEWITLHSLRRTFVTVLCALGEDPLVAMDEIGQIDPGRRSPSTGRQCSWRPVRRRGYGRWSTARRRNGFVARPKSQLTCSTAARNWQ
jgi:integrase